MKNTARLTAAIATAVLAVGLSACGGSGSTTESAATSVSDTSSGAEGGSKAKAGGSQRKAVSESKAKANAGDAASSSPKVKVKVAPLRVSGGGSKPFQSKGGDNSIQTYGDEASDTELTEAAKALHDYLAAFARDDWQEACSHMTESLVKNFEQLGARAAGSKRTTCAEGFAALYGATKRSGEVRHQLTEVDAASLRREGEQAFLIYHGTDYDTGSYYGAADLYSMPMKLEGGEWKVGLVVGSTMGIAKALVKKK